MQIFPTMDPEKGNTFIVEQYQWQENKASSKGYR